MKEKIYEQERPADKWVKALSGQEIIGKKTSRILKGGLIRKQLCISQFILIFEY